jgi:hypothetical protein
MYGFVCTIIGSLLFTTGVSFANGDRAFDSARDSTSGIVDDRLLLFAGISPSFSRIKDISELNKDYTASAEGFGLSLKSGIIFWKGMIEVSATTDYKHFNIVHDNNEYQPYLGLRYFSEDNIETGIFSLGLGIGFNPFNNNTLSPYFSIGLLRNQYVNYSRLVYEELLFPDSNIVLCNKSNILRKPGSYNSVSLSCGMNYKFNRHSLIRCLVSYDYIKPAGFGIKNCVDISVEYNHFFEIK